MSLENGALGGTRAGRGAWKKLPLLSPPPPQICCASALSDPINGQRQGAWEEALQRQHLRTQSVDQIEQGWWGE